MKSENYLEHVNYTVNNLDNTIKFIQLAMPDFKIRGGGEFNGRKWVHIGTYLSYLAINEAVKNSNKDKDYDSRGTQSFWICSR